MIQFDRHQQKIAFSLFVVALLATSLLALVDQATEAPIYEAKRAALHKSLVQVLPEYHNNPLNEMFDFPLTEKQVLQVFPAKDKQGKLIAYAWEQVAPDGYSGSIRILMGVRASGEIVAIRVIDHRETPGLGDGITKNQAWLDYFIDKTLNNTKWNVKKDGGHFDQFTGATVTPRAVVKAVHQGLTIYKDNKNSFLKTLAIKEVENLQKQAGGKAQ